MNINNNILEGNSKNKTIFDISEVVDFLSINNTKHELGATPIEKEFYFIIDIWKNNIINTVETMKYQLNQLVEIREMIESEDDREYFQEITNEFEKNKNNLLLENLHTLYNNMNGEVKKLIQEIKTHSNDPKINLFLVALILLSDQNNGENSEHNQWIDHTLNKVVSINKKITSLHQVLSKNISGKNTFKNIFIQQLRLIVHEILAVLTATGCHIIKEDCSVLIQSIKIKPLGFSDKNYQRSFQNGHLCFQNSVNIIMSYVDKVNQLNKNDFFGSFSEHLGKEESRDEMKNNYYLLTPIILDAKDVVLYLNFLDQYFGKLVHSLKGTSHEKSKFSIKSNSVLEKDKQPRVKLHDSENDFNIRFDYNKRNKAVEMDIGGVAFQLQNNNFLPDTIQEKEKIIGNSYTSLEKTNRIMNNTNLKPEEQIAIVHSVLMIQGSNILGRDANNMFGYHYTLWENVSEEDFRQVIDCFKVQ